MSKKHKRHFLKAKETEAFLKEASEKMKIDLKNIFQGAAKIEIAETELGELYFINGKPLIFKREDQFLPTLIFNEFLNSASKVIVDKGAIPHICNGANVMAPGIVRIEGAFRKGDLVSIVEETYGKPIALGEALLNSEDAAITKKGAVLKNIHFVGDKLWNILKDVAKQLK
jgi:PUA domain protein